MRTRLFIESLLKAFTKQKNKEGEKKPKQTKDELRGLKYTKA